MWLIIGGAYQGKADYAYSLVGENVKAVDFSKDTDMTVEEACSNQVIINLHLFIRELLRQDIDPYRLVDLLCQEDKIITINELGCGVVPIDKDDRQWREISGRISCILAKNAGHVVRMTCAIPTVIK